jgi:hypothetical protein
LSGHCDNSDHDDYDELKAQVAALEGCNEVADEWVRVAFERLLQDRDSLRNQLEATSKGMNEEAKFWQVRALKAEAQLTAQPDGVLRKAAREYIEATRYEGQTPAPQVAALWHRLSNALTALTTPASSTPPEGKVREALEHALGGLATIHTMGPLTQQGIAAAECRKEAKALTAPAASTPPEGKVLRAMMRVFAGHPFTEQMRRDLQALAAPAPAPQKVYGYEKCLVCGGQHQPGLPCPTMSVTCLGDAPAPACKTCGGRRVLIDAAVPHGDAVVTRCPDCNAGEGNRG